MLYQEGLKTLKKGLEKGVSKNDFLKSGFKKLDKKYGGIFKKGITVIAGTNQDDLTNFGVSLLKNVSLNKEVSSYYISFHDIEIDIVKKITSALLKIKMKNIISGKLKKRERSKIEKLIKSDTVFPTYIINNIKQDTVELTYMVKNLIFDKHPHLFILDGLTNINGTENEKMKLIESLKSISYNTGVPFVLLYELSDSGKTYRSNGTPFQLDFNSNRYLKSMSDSILYLTDPIFDKSKDKKGKTSKGISELVIRKSKYGRTGSVSLRYKTNFCLFEDFAG
jgi:replicative DNA helicase